MPKQWNKELKILLALLFPVALLNLMGFLPIRMMALPFFLLTLFLFYFQFWKGPKYLWIVSLLCSVILCLMPFDVGTMDYPGPPRFVPLVIGYPSPEGSERAGLGEIVLGGRSFGNDPKWIWVW